VGRDRTFYEIYQPCGHDALCALPDCAGQHTADPVLVTG